MLDQLAAAPIENLHLPVSDDARIRQLTEGMLSSPADKSTLGQWAQRIGMSERSLSRTLQQQMGMSWPLAAPAARDAGAAAPDAGESVQTVALDLGYESASGFVTMFRKTVGKPPARGRAQRLWRDPGRRDYHVKSRRRRRLEAGENQKS